MYNRGIWRSNIQHSSIKEINKSNDKSNNRWISRLTEKVPILRRSVWYFKITNNSVRNTKIGYGTENIAFGSYTMVYIGKYNIMKIRCALEIALKASRNSGG